MYQLEEKEMFVQNVKLLSSPNQEVQQSKKG